MVQAASELDETFDHFAAVRAASAMVIGLLRPWS
jgi:hypothetical protein